MKRHLRLIPFAVLLILLAAPFYAEAKTMYVSDQIVITMRTGKGGEYRIIEHLKSNTAVEILREEDTYSLVRTPEGKEGWVRNQYLTEETPKPLVIDTLRNEIAGIKAAAEGAEQLAAVNERLLAENKALKADNNELADENRSLRRREMVYWFLAGAGVFFIGWLTGRISRQKRYY